MQKGEDFSVDENDIGQFFGLLLFSGYHQVPEEDLYWSTQEDFSVPIVSTVMPRSRFRKMKKFFHIIDNNKLTSGDKMGKITPFYSELKKNFQQFGIFHSKLSIGESMVPYYGHHSAKMFYQRQAD
ncbi:piggyBac transposable element-derived protein 3 [Trichonephila clavata]|uniref:PiggyBac transposable element-derived protein 3 n=1 Tax=Trichonephila clavata TaxID=2740835 RepID=A0A8X6KR48_TRICU|nr:piggyBac transposable element-derived protein 3 [Trichonephila clavata]